MTAQKATKKKRVINAAKKIAKHNVERELVSFDFAVKYLLRGKRDFVILNGFLSELLGKKVEVKAIVESENNKADKDGKTNRVDLKAQINGGELVVFEIQFLQEFDFFGKVLYGVSTAVTEQITKGKLYNIKNVYSVNIAYSNLNAKREYLFSGKFKGFQGIHYKDELIPFAQTGNPKSKKMIDIHPEYYLILPKMFDEKLRSRFDEWVYILKKSTAREDFRAAGIKEAKVKLDYMKMSPAKKRRYNTYMENRRSADSVVLTAEGKGIQIGRREGKREGQEKERIKNIKNMYKAGATIAQLVNGFGLSVKNVKQILGL